MPWLNSVGNNQLHGRPGSAAPGQERIADGAKVLKEMQMQRMCRCP